MKFRRFAAFVLLTAGIAAILMGDRGAGINGFTILGVALAIGGIALAD